MSRILIIAEAGVNHNGDPGRARALIDAAAGAGADVVKFQWFSAERLVTRSAPRAAYQRSRAADGDTQFEMLRALELAPAVWTGLAERCREAGVEFLATAFDRESLDRVHALGVWRLKVPSGEIDNLPYLRQTARYGLPVLLSTGMATLGEVEAALRVFAQEGLDREAVTVLHCTTAYPTPAADVNLRAMRTMADAFGVQVGYSDHTLGTAVAVAAAALGATVIEKHFTLDRTLPGPDHAASLEPGELADLVRDVRTVEAALGDGRKRPAASEAENARVVRKSIVARRRIHEGEAFTEENLTAKRPGTGISPMRWDEVIGRTATRDYEPDEAITW